MSPNETKTEQNVDISLRRSVIIPYAFVGSLSFEGLSFEGECPYPKPRMVLVEEGNPLYKMSEGCLVKKTDDGWALIWFPNCSSVCIPACVTELETSILKDNEFLDEVSVHSDNQRFKAIEGKYLIDKREQTLVACPQSSELLCLPCDDDLRRIETGFFDALWGVDELRLSSSVVAIEIGSVYFRKLYVPNSVNKIVFNALIMGSTLKEITYEGTSAQWDRIIIVSDDYIKFVVNWKETVRAKVIFERDAKGCFEQVKLDQPTKKIRVHCEGDGQTIYVRLRSVIEKMTINIQPAVKAIAVPQLIGEGRFVEKKRRLCYVRVRLVE